MREPSANDTATDDAALETQERRGLRAAAGVLCYAAQAWALFLLAVLGGLLVVLLVPGLARRRRWVSLCARLPFRLADMAPRVTGTGRLPREQCIVVANHSSYLDGILLKGFLPPQFSYVIKREIHRVPLAGFLLRRIGSRFVDRSGDTRSARDARTLLRAAGDGESLVFFPEGTFVAAPGLQRFRPGAFAAAMRTGLPVVPVVIRGTRHILPSGSLLPRRGPVEIEVLEPLDASVARDSKSLAELARRRILDALGEPDLATAGH